MQCPSGQLGVLGYIDFSRTLNGVAEVAVALLRKNAFPGGVMQAGWSRVYAGQNTSPAAVAGEAARAASEGASTVAANATQAISGMRQAVYDAKIAAGSVIYFLAGASGGYPAGWYLYNPTQLLTSGKVSSGNLVVEAGSQSYPAFGSQIMTLASDPSDFAYLRSQLPALAAAHGTMWTAADQQNPASLVGAGSPSSTLASIANPTTSTSSLFMLALLAAGGAFLYYEL